MSVREKIASSKPEEVVSCLHHCKYGGCDKLEVHDWLSDISAIQQTTDIVEVRFKNTRKGFYKNVNGLKLIQGDIVAVEASPGHDIGIISLTGELVLLQLTKHKISPTNYEFKKVYRKAKESDVEKWQEAMHDETRLLIYSREVAERLNLNMKIGDVEFQGDKTKAIFYYIADERVDFREMIKILAEDLKIRIEMRQIGARQEAGRIGGIGPCGRELCCTNWLTEFSTVSTNAARQQDLSLNPQKLAGQCSKLKCCLNYELDTYQDAAKEFPNFNITLMTEEGEAFFKKHDILKKTMWYSYSKDDMANLIALPVSRVKEIIDLNKKGIKVPSISVEQLQKDKPKPVDYANVVGQDDLTRFDKKNQPYRNTNRNNNNNNNNNNNRNTNRNNNNTNNTTNNSNSGNNSNPNNNRKKFIKQNNDKTN